MMLKLDENLEIVADITYDKFQIRHKIKKGLFGGNKLTTTARHERKKIMRDSEIVISLIG